MKNDLINYGNTPATTLSQNERYSIIAEALLVEADARKENTIYFIPVKGIEALFGLSNTARNLNSPLGKQYIHLVEFNGRSFSAISNDAYSFRVNPSRK